MIRKSWMTLTALSLLAAAAAAAAAVAAAVGDKDQLGPAQDTNAFGGGTQCERTENQSAPSVTTGTESENESLLISIFKGFTADGSPNTEGACAPSGNACPTVCPATCATKTDCKCRKDCKCNTRCACGKNCECAGGNSDKCCCGKNCQCGKTRACGDKCASKKTDEGLVGGAAEPLNYNFTSSGPLPYPFTSNGSKTPSSGPLNENNISRPAPFFAPAHYDDNLEGIPFRPANRTREHHNSKEQEGVAPLLQSSYVYPILFSIERLTQALLDFEADIIRGLGDFAEESETPHVSDQLIRKPVKPHIAVERPKW